MTKLTSYKFDTSGYKQEVAAKIKEVEKLLRNTEHVENPYFGSNLETTIMLFSIGGLELEDGSKIKGHGWDSYIDPNKGRSFMHEIFFPGDELFTDIPGLIKNLERICGVFTREEYTMAYFSGSRRTVRLNERRSRGLLKISYNEKEERSNEKSFHTNLLISPAPDGFFDRLRIKLFYRRCTDDVNPLYTDAVPLGKAVSSFTDSLEAYTIFSSEKPMDQELVERFTITLGRKPKVIKEKT